MVFPLIQFCFVSFRFFSSSLIYRFLLHSPIHTLQTRVAFADCERCQIRQRSANEWNNQLALLQFHTQQVQSPCHYQSYWWPWNGEIIKANPYTLYWGSEMVRIFGIWSTWVNLNIHYNQKSRIRNDFRLNIIISYATEYSNQYTDNKSWINSCTITTMNTVFLDYTIFQWLLWFRWTSINKMPAPHRTFSSKKL